MSAVDDERTIPAWYAHLKGHRSDRGEAPMSVAFAESEVRFGTHPGPFTIEDIFALPEDGMRHELLDGSIIVTPPPNIGHQLCADGVVEALKATASPEVKVLDNLGVTTPGGMFIPDVVVIPAAVAYAGGALLRAADVLAAIEIMSPSSRTLDRRVKPAAYAEAGIPTYWRVELDGPDAPLVVVYALDGGAYVEVCRIRNGEVMEIDRPYPARVEPAAFVGPSRPLQESSAEPDTG
jgi:Uma2 family endonuclease